MSTDDFTFALIREFLQRNNFTNTLEAFMLESSSTQKISRSNLIKQLGLTKLYMQNKEREHPYPSLIQTLVHNLQKCSKLPEQQEKAPRPIRPSTAPPPKAPTIQKNVPSTSNKLPPRKTSSRPSSSYSVSSVDDVHVEDFLDTSVSKPLLPAKLENVSSKRLLN
ncbi:hypothetical protein GEMRC1_007882 [Eukaryota sp. GEM-RC1]